MKVICVTYDYIGPYSSFSIENLLKIGEWYEVSDNENYYTVYLTDNSFANLAKGYFKTIEQIREEKLNELL